MSFFKENLTRIEKETKRQTARQRVSSEIVRAVDALVPATKERIEKAREKVRLAQVVLLEEENSLQYLLKAKTCDHDFVPDGDESDGRGATFSEKCRHCNWVHYC